VAALARRAQAEDPVAQDTMAITDMATGTGPERQGAFPLSRDQFGTLIPFTGDAEARPRPTFWQIPNKEQKELLAIVETTRPEIVEER